MEKEPFIYTNRKRSGERNVRKHKVFRHVPLAKIQIRLRYQPAHSRSLVRTFTGSIWDSQVCKMASCDNEDWSDCANAHADLSLHWAHMSEVKFTHVAVFIYWDMPGSVSPRSFEQYLRTYEPLLEEINCRAEKTQISKCWLELYTFTYPIGFHGTFLFDI